ncbi:MAG: M3 family metallopeptidase [Alphaproteobacteria bacterium]|nr:M3 family metallopeptidase [Alphaproteobacteria bacterium]
MTDNPLLIPSTLPQHAPDFPSILDEHYMPALHAALAEARANIAALKANPAPADFENTIVALETASEALGEVNSVFYNMLSVIGGDALHALAEEIGPLNAAFSNDVALDPELFARVKSVYDRKNGLTLTTEQHTLLEETYKGFVRGGALLADDKKARLREISASLSVLGPSFMNNTKKSAEAYELILTDESDLAGLPDTARASARQAAQEKNIDKGWLITLDAPSFGPFLQFSARRDLREKVWRAFSTRAWGDAYDNSENIRKIVALRREQSQLLGYESLAAYVLEERMAKSEDEVFAFLDTLKNAYRPAAEHDLARLKDFARARDGLEDLKPWDVGYYSELLRQSLFNFSSEEVRPYFPLERVLEGCFAHFSALFAMKFVPAQNYALWHPDVKVFEVFDEKSGRFIGTLYTDFYPRIGKKEGAWKSALRNQGLHRGKVERPLVSIVCNFTKPTPEHPSLLTHDEVLTLFHEMGHATHALLSDVTYAALAGTSVKWDFVELPSQVQENWCYEKETLDKLSGHYQTGAKIPQDLIDKLRAAKNYMGGWAGLRQVSFALLDMAWHSRRVETFLQSAEQDVGAFEDSIMKDVALFPRLGGPFSASFSHIFAGGYAAGYYSYKWAEVLDADTFEFFLERGLYDSSVAEAYKREILARGGSEHPAILYRRFRGRDADPQALLRREGLLEQAA